MTTMMRPKQGEYHVLDLSDEETVVVVDGEMFSSVNTLTTEHRHVEPLVCSRCHLPVRRHSDSRCAAAAPAPVNTMPYAVINEIHRSIPLRTGRGQNNRENWRAAANRARKEKSATLLAMGGHRRLQPGEVAVVTLTRVSPGKLDDDNLVGSLKYVRDAVALWLGVDDGSRRVKFTYADRLEAPASVDVDIMYVVKAPA